jgi:enamine deaminase RidA (YjgF/YER057c/UK114 family)
VVVSGHAAYVSGQVAVDASGALVGADVAVQTRQVLANLDHVLQSIGASRSDILRTTTYVIRAEDLDQVRRVRAGYFDIPAPASTLLVVSQLAKPDYLVEIEAIVAVSDAVGETT